MELTAHISELLEQKFKTDEEFADCFTVDVELKPGNRLNIFVDSDSGISFDKCRGISRYIEGYLDTEGWLGEKYVLEVSSPGVDRPLKFPRQYTRQIGRTVEVITVEEKRIKGTLIKADEGQIVLEQERTEKEGKKKKKVIEEIIIPYEHIEKAKVKIKW